MGRPHGPFGVRDIRRDLSRRAGSFSGRDRNGGAERDRTADLCVANAALSQLSYGPTAIFCPGKLKPGTGVPASGSHLRAVLSERQASPGGVVPGWTSGGKACTISVMGIELARILVPIYFSEHAESVVEWAGHLAEEHGSEIVLLHVYHVPVEFQQVEGAYLPADFWTSLKEEAKRQLAQFGSGLRERGLPVEEVTREGYPATVIEDEAARIGADLVVIGSRGRTGLKHLLLGSIAERVVQKAPCPVLTVKRRD